MEIIKGKNSEEITKDDYQNIINGFGTVILDIGTGDGKFIYNEAKSNPENFYIGLDPNRNALEKYSSKIYKKPSKGGLDNAMFIIARIEDLPEELSESIDKIYINFPWSGLLKITVEPDIQVLDQLKNICRQQKTSLEMHFNYSSKYEPVEMQKLEIEDLSEEYIEKTMKPAYKKADIYIENYKKYDNEFIKDFDAQWSKRLAYGRKREIWSISAIINK